MDLAYAALEIGTFIGYFSVLFLVAALSYRKQRSDQEFLLGNRSLNFWLTALSAHASDMSGWLFIGYPALVFTKGVSAAWAAIGLTFFMYLNWQFIAPRLRIASEQLQSLTLSAYFESRFGDTSGRIRMVSAVMSVLFLTFYISSGLVGLGVLVESLFGLSYVTGIAIGLLIVMLYVFMGGYRTIAWIDLFQGFFLLAVILYIPASLLLHFGGFTPVLDAVRLKGLSDSLLPDFSTSTLWHVLMAASGWGLGYFGQPQILTKFMGIRRVEEIHKAKYVGITWQGFALAAATIVGLIGVFLFPEGLADPEQVILNIVKKSLTPFIAGLVLCAILAATTNVMSAQILVVSSNISEDFYKKLFRKNATPEELLWVSRCSVIGISLIGFLIAFFKISSIYKLVLYSWSGLGASFGPLLLLSLYLKNINRYGAFAGILTGGIVAAAWPLVEQATTIPSLVAGFALSILAIQAVSWITRKHLHLSLEP